MSKGTPLLALMHDTAHDLNIIKQVTVLLGKELDKLQLTDVQKKEFHTYLTHIKNCSANCMSTLDVYYVETKKTQMT